MIMPIDIEKKEFTREKKGYSPSEVDEFLDLVTVDYEKLLNENRNMIQKIRFLEKQVFEAQKADNSIVDTLERAKELMADISASAERRAEIIMKDAELEADNIKKQARLEVFKLTEEQAKLKTQVERFRDKFQRMLEDETNRFNDDEYGFLEEIEVINNQEVPEVIEEEEPAEVKPAIDDTLVVNKPQEEFPFMEETKEETQEEDEEEDELTSLFGEKKATVDDLADGLKNYSNQSVKGGGTLFK